MPTTMALLKQRVDGWKGPHDYKEDNMRLVGLVSASTYQSPTYGINIFALTMLDNDEYRLANLDFRCAYLAVHKYDRLYPSLSSVVVKSLFFGLEVLKKCYGRYLSEVKCRTFDEALNYVATGSSMGYPMRAIYPQRENALADGRFLRYLRELLASPLDIDCPSTVWTSFLKEELRPTPKVLDQRTRNITSSELILSIIAKMITDPLDKAIEDLRQFCPIKMGISVYSEEWNLLTKSFLDGNKLLYSVDYSAYDSTIPRFLILLAKTFRDHFIVFDNECQCQLFDMLYNEIMNTLILGPKGELYFKCHGQNSGSPLTCSDNSIINAIIIYAAYHYFNPVVPWYDLLDDLNVGVFGDDAIFCTKNSSFFSAEKLGEFVSLLGMSIKRETMQPLARFEFLSSFSRNVSGKWRPVPSRGRYMSSLALKSPTNGLDALASVTSHMVLYQWDYASWSHIQLVGIKLIESYDLANRGNASWDAHVALVRMRYTAFLHHFSYMWE